MDTEEGRIRLAQPGQPPSSPHGGLRDSLSRNPELYALLALSVCLLVCFTWFHEVSRAFVRDLPDAGFSPSFVSCILHSFGVFLGALALTAPKMSRWVAAHARSFAKGTSMLLLASTGGFHCELAINHSSFGVFLFGTTSSLLCTVLIALTLCALLSVEVRLIAVGLAVCIALCALIDYIALPWIIASLPLWTLAVLHCAFALIALVILAKASGPCNLVEAAVSSRRPVEGQGQAAKPSGNQEGTAVSETKQGNAGGKRALLDKWPPVVHLLSYGFSFGFLHTSVGIFQLLGPMRNALEFSGALIAAGLVVATYYRATPTAREVWTNMRRLVYPMLTGFVIIPALMHSVAATVFADAATCYYGCLFVLGCVFMMKETVLSPLKVTSLGMLFLSVGMVVGLLCGFLPYLFESTSDQFILSLCIMIAFISTTVGTLWVGDDHALRTWWGMRRNYTAKHYKEQLILDKCKRVASAHGLSDRECEVLLLLAQGRRATQIKDDLFISINTVRVHIRNIYNKLDVHSVKQLTDLLDEVVL